jgi:hypothetical protein
MFLVMRNVTSTVFSCKQSIPAWSYSHSGTVAEVSAHSTVWYGPLTPAGNPSSLVKFVKDFSGI